MALIAMCVHSTDDNDRFKYTKECLESLSDTVDMDKNDLIVVNNASSQTVYEWLIGYILRNPTVILKTFSQNKGTAAGINVALKHREHGQVCIKMDDDVVIHQSEWVDEVESTIANNPNIGILGLKRDDVYGDFTEDGKLLWSEDIIGTCTAFNPLMLDRCGYMQQPSKYGFDDTNFSVRSIAAGFRNAFLPHIKITHLDDGTSEYSKWKRKEAGIYLSEVGSMLELIKQGKLSYYYDGGFND